MKKGYLNFFFFLFVFFVSSCIAAPIIPPLISSESSLLEFSKKKNCPLKPKKIKIQGLFGKIQIKSSENLQLEYEGISDELARFINLTYYKPISQKSRLNMDASDIKLKNSSDKTSMLYRSASFGPFSKQARALTVEQQQLIASDRVEIEEKEAANAIFHVYLPNSVDEVELIATTFPIVAQFENHFNGKFYFLANQPCKLVDSSIKTIDVNVTGEANSLVLDKTYAEMLNVRLVNGGALNYANSSIKTGGHAKTEVNVFGRLIYGSHELILGAGKTDLLSTIKKLDTGKPKKTKAHEKILMKSYGARNWN
ncbi:MAG: hypothetical protein ACRCYZ_00980 [Alphaproteobacteria bacterium]